MGGPSVPVVPLGPNQPTSIMVLLTMPSCGDLTNCVKCIWILFEEVAGAARDTLGPTGAIYESCSVLHTIQYYVLSIFAFQPVLKGIPVRVFERGNTMFTLVIRSIMIELWWWGIPQLGHLVNIGWLPSQPRGMCNGTISRGFTMPGTGGYNLCKSTVADRQTIFALSSRYCKYGPHGSG